MKIQGCGTLQCAVVGQARKEKKKSPKSFIKFFWATFLFINKEGTILPEWDLSGCADSFVPWLTLQQLSLLPVLSRPFTMWHFFTAGSALDPTRTMACQQENGNSMDCKTPQTLLLKKIFVALLHKLANYLNISLLATTIITSLNFS